MECLSCLSLSGERRISPGPVIYEGTHWVVEHAYPTTHLGWLVIVSKRHIEALHELSVEAFQELAKIEYKLVQVMHTDRAVEEEYLMCFAEAKAFTMSTSMWSPSLLICRPRSKARACLDSWQSIRSVRFLPRS